MKGIKKWGLLLGCMILAVMMLTGCGSTESKRIIRIGHNQSTNHPTHIALVAFQNFINEKLGDKYVVEVYPSELLGSQTDMVQLTQTGAIDYCVASNAIFGNIQQKLRNFQSFRTCLQVQKLIIMSWMIRKLPTRSLPLRRKQDSGQ